MMLVVVSVSSLQAIFTLTLFKSSVKVVLSYFNFSFSVHRLILKVEHTSFIMLFSDSDLIIFIEFSIKFMTKLDSDFVCSNSIFLLFKFVFCIE